MAGPGVLNAANFTAERQRQPHRPAQAAFSRCRLIEASLTIEGRVFRTLVHEGTPVNALIEKVVKENGGSVEKVFYPSLNASEIVAVRIGGICLVKSGTAGLHFYVGSSGIPFASLPSGIVFPNGDELRVRATTYDIHLGTTADNFDPKTASDFGQRYAGGARTTAAAMRKMQEEVKGAHGDSRSERLLLPDNLLVMDKETGEIRTASEHAAKIAVEGFAAPQFVTPTYTSVGLTLASDRGVLAVPMDGSATRVPYLFVRTFDGRITDHVSVRFNSLKAEENAPLKLSGKPAPRADAQPLYFASASAPHAVAHPASPPEARAAPPPPFASPVASLRAPPAMPPVSAETEKGAGPAHAHRQEPAAALTPAAVGHFWRNPPPERMIPPVPAPRAAPVQPPSRPARVSVPPAMPPRRAAGREAVQRRKGKKPEPSFRDARPKSCRQPPVQAKTARARKTTETQRQAPEKRRTRPNKKPETQNSKPGTRAPGPVPRAIPDRARPPQKQAEFRAGPGALRPVPARKTRPADAKKGAGRRRRKTPGYFMMDLLGILPKRRRMGKRAAAAMRGRASAGNLAGKTRAPWP